MNDRNLEISVNEKDEIKDIDKFDIRMRRIYEMIGLGIPLTDENLKFYLINKDDVQELVSNSILVNMENNNILNGECLNKNQYTVGDLSKLYQYGIKLSADKQYLKATRFFYKCYESEPDNREYSLRMLLVYIKENCLEEAVSVLSHIQTLEPDKYQYDNIIYLYLLNMLVDCGENVNKLENFDPDNLMYNDKKRDMLQEQRNIRRAIYINKFKYAYQLLIEYVNLYRDYSIEYKLLRELLNQTVNKEERMKKSLSRFVKMERYEDVIDVLDELKKHRYLNTNEMYLYLLSEKIINIKDTRVIPQITITDARYLYDAIKGNNFVVAQELNDKYLIRKSKDMSMDLVNLLLERINDLILEIKLESIEEKFTLKEETDSMEIVNIDESDDEDLLFAKEIAYYIKSENLSIDYAKKYLGVRPSQMLLIKLIYVRDYYIEGLDYFGDELLREVEECNDKDECVYKFLNEIKRNRDVYRKRNNNQIIRRKLCKDKN